MTSLWKITVGENFEFYGENYYNGNRFPEPSDDYLYSVTGITGATGNWYNTRNTEYAVADVPNKTADTYIAYPTYTVTLVLPGNGSVTANRATTYQIMGNGTYSVTLTAAGGYEITSVTADGKSLASSGNTSTLNITGETTGVVTSSVKATTKSSSGSSSGSGSSSSSSEVTVTSSAQTGDTANPILWAVIMLTALAGGGLAVYGGRKRKNI
ncbi:MAG: LPXTG cell wall anchor domain-containing protein [Lachnospiraceae bacterium]|nr:LPXTG cell wall anchor domain-containing protein [Lachnospiraceae bacterium]